MKGLMLAAALALAASAAAQERPTPIGTPGTPEPTRDQQLAALLNDAGNQLKLINLQLSFQMPFGGGEVPANARPKTVKEADDLLLRLEAQIKVTRQRIAKVETEIAKTPELTAKLDQEQAALDKLRNFIKTNVQGTAGSIIKGEGNPMDRVNELQRKVDADRALLRKAPETLASYKRDLERYGKQQAELMKLRSTL